MGMNPRASGQATTKEGKKEVVERTKKLIDESQLIISVASSGISKEQIDMLRKAVPKTSKASVVKNTLMKVALEGTEFESMRDTISHENLFFFIPEGDARQTFEEFEKWQKEAKRDGDKGNAKHAMMEGQLYSGHKTIKGVSKLPTRLELITKIGIAVKMVPTKVGRGVNAVPNKLGRAFGALKDKIAEDEGAA
jgi:large subunit ribosomal protein L10